MADDNSSKQPTSGEEAQQLQQTVEMFEAITQHQPEDYQSLEILKEAYGKLGKPEDSVRISKKLAQAYVACGQVSQAIFEYEGILQQFPNDISALTALAELDAKTSQWTGTDAAAPLAPTVTTTLQSAADLSASKPEDGNRALANVLIAEKLATSQAIDPLLQKLKTIPAGQDKTGNSALIQILTNDHVVKLEDILTAIVNRSGLPYLPLGNYDVDRDVAFLVPQEICWEHLMIPFDLISRSVLIATANPFDQQARDRVQGILDYSVFWYVAAPLEIAAALRRVHGQEGQRGGQVKS